MSNGVLGEKLHVKVAWWRAKSSSAHRWRAVPSPSHCWPRSTHSCMGGSRLPLHCNHMHIKCTCLW